MIPVFQIQISSGKQFPAAEGETLLDAALRAGVVLEHSCRSGRCNTCKSQVVAGITLPVHDETGLSADERAAGWVLTCSRSAASDVALDVTDLGDWPLAPARTVPCRIQMLDRLAPDVMRVVLRLPPAQSVSFRPGQYVDLIGPGGVRRSYSLAVAPAADHTLELHVRAVDAGVMSRYWFEQAKLNDLLRLHGPLGTFFLRDIADCDLVFLATGTGMAPIKAMLEDLARRDAAEQPRSISVYWGARAEADFYWDPRTLGLPLQYVPVHSRAGPGWVGARGHVQQVALAQALQLDVVRVYACGSDAMIQSARAAFVAGGLAERHFHADAFVSSS